MPDLSITEVVVVNMDADFCSECGHMFSLPSGVCKYCGHYLSSNAGGSDDSFFDDELLPDEDTDIFQSEDQELSLR